MQLKMVPFGFFFKECCNHHDSHYALCGFSKVAADEQMLMCMIDVVYKRHDLEYSMISRLRASIGYTFFGMVELFGCKAWEIAQRTACVCLLDK